MQGFEKAGIANAKIYFHMTRGSDMRSHGWNDHIKPNFFMTITELCDNSKIKARGVAVSTYPDLRWKRCDIKSLNLLANVLAKQDAEKKGCFEAILVNEEGFITEGSSSAFFAIENKTLYTAPLSENILPSITRKYVIKAAENTDLKIEQKQLMPSEATEADELFIAVTTQDILPVIKFDNTEISNHHPGRYTKILIDAFKEFIQ